MDFFSSSKGKKEGKRSRFFGKKTPSASTPQSPIHPAGSRSPPPDYYSNKRAESEYEFRSSEERAGYVMKQPASERVPAGSSGYAFRDSDERAGYVMKHPASERVPAVSSGYAFRDSGERAGYVMKHPASERVPAVASGYAFQSSDERGGYVMKQPASERVPAVSSGYAFQSSDERGGYVMKQPASERVPAVSTGYAFRSSEEENGGYMWKQPASERVPAASSGYAFRSSDEENGGYVLKQPASERVPASSSRYAFQSPDDEQYAGYIWKQPASERVPTASGYAFRSDDENAGYVRRQLPPVRVQASHGKPPLFASHTPDRRSNHGKEKVEDEYEDPRAQRTPRHSLPRRSAPPSPKREEESRSPPPAYYSNEKSESENSDDNFSFIEDQSAYMYPEIATHSRPVSGNSTPVHYKFQMTKETEDEEKVFEPPELPDESQSFSLTEIAKMRGMKTYEVEKEEIQSVISELYVPVGNYRVRASVSSTLQSILDKYGDIASGSKLQSLSTRSYYLDSLSSVVLELKSTALRDLTEIRVRETMAVVKDLESVKIDVSWLTKILAELLEAAACYDRYEAAEADKEICERDLQTTKKEADEQMKELNLKEKEIKEFREKVTECGAKVGQLEMRGARLKKDLVFLKSKVEKFVGETVMV